jgi:hypothetical protein
MTGKISKWSSFSERRNCVCYAGKEDVLSVRNEGRLTSQGANSSGERGKVTYVMVTAESRAVGDRSRVTVVSLCSAVHQMCDQVRIISGGLCTFCEEASASVFQSDVRLACVQSLIFRLFLFTSSLDYLLTKSMYSNSTFQFMVFCSF